MNTFSHLFPCFFVPFSLPLSNLTPTGVSRAFSLASSDHDEATRTLTLLAATEQDEEAARLTVIEDLTEAAHAVKNVTDGHGFLQKFKEARATAKATAKAVVLEVEEGAKASPAFLFASGIMYVASATLWALISLYLIKPQLAIPPLEEQTNLEGFEYGPFAGEKCD